VAAGVASEFPDPDNEDSRDGWSMAHSQVPSGWRRATSTVVPPPGSLVEVSARSPLSSAGRWPPELKTGRLASSSRYAARISAWPAATRPAGRASTASGS